MGEREGWRERVKGREGRGWEIVGRVGRETPDGWIETRERGGGGRRENRRE